MNLTDKLGYLEYINEEILRIARKKGQTPDRFIDDLGIIEHCLDYDVKIPRTQLPMIPLINIPAAQANLLNLYARNPILKDAIEGRQTVEESARELGKINRPISRLFPREVNEGQNRRLDHFEELVGMKPGLRTRGFSYDNFLVAFSGASILRSLSIYAAIQNNNYYANTTFDLAVSTLAAPVVIGAFAIWMRSTTSGLVQAKYLDSKIEELL